MPVSQQQLQQFIQALMGGQQQPRQQQQFWQQPRQQQQQQQQNPWASQMMRQAAIQAPPQGGGEMSPQYAGGKSYWEQNNIPMSYGTPAGAYNYTTDPRFEQVRSAYIQASKSNGYDPFSNESAIGQYTPAQQTRINQNQSTFEQQNPTLAKAWQEMQQRQQGSMYGVQPQGGAYMNDGFRTGGGDIRDDSYQNYLPAAGFDHRQLGQSFGSQQMFGQQRQQNPYMQAMGYGGGSNAKDSYTDRYLQGGFGGGQQQGMYPGQGGIAPNQGTVGSFGTRQMAVQGNPYSSQQQNPFMQQSPFTAFGLASQGASRQQPIYGAGLFR